MSAKVSPKHRNMKSQSDTKQTNSTLYRLPAPHFPFPPIAADLGGKKLGKGTGARYRFCNKWQPMYLTSPRNSTCDLISPSTSILLRNIPVLAKSCSMQMQTLFVSELFTALITFVLVQSLGNVAGSLQYLRSHICIHIV